MFGIKAKPKKKKSIKTEIKEMQKEIKTNREKAKLEGELASLKQERAKIKRQKLVNMVKGARTGMRSVGNVLEKTFRHTQPLGIDLRPVGNGNRKKRK